MQDSVTRLIVRGIAHDFSSVEISVSSSSKKTNCDLFISTT